MALPTPPSPLMASTCPVRSLLASSTFLILLLLSTPTTSWASPSTSSLDAHPPVGIDSLCNSTPHPDACFQSLRLSLNITVSPTILNFLLQSLHIALSQVGKLDSLLATAAVPPAIVEKQRGAVQDCRDLHQITLSSLHKTLSRIKSGKARDIADGRAFLSAALTNRDTCLEGLGTASGPLKATLISSLTDAYNHVDNCLSLISKPGGGPDSPSVPGLGRRALELDIGDDGPDPGEVLTVAADGSGNFTTIMDAVRYAPNDSDQRTIIYIKQGVYNENVEIPMNKTNIVMIGDGSDVTVITGSRSYAGGWTTFRSATVAVSGDGFLSRDITFANSAGPDKGQAVALRINADLAAVYRCTITGYQDTLYVHSFRQFYRECDIYGTVDYIFGNAAVVFQGSNIVSRLPLPGQFTVITAQSRDNPDENTGISMQNCSILATDELYNHSVSSFLGRPWKPYSRVVIIESYIDAFIDPAGWHEWVGDQGLDTLYYGEYDNTGPGAATDRRVDWAGYHVMNYDDASSFTVSEFIAGDEWLDSTSVPYDDGV